MKQEAMSSSTLQASAKSSSMTSSREETTQEITRSSASSATAKKVQMMQNEQRARMLEVSQRASSQQRSASSRREQAQEVKYQKAADIKVANSRNEETWRFLQDPVSRLSRKTQGICTITNTHTHLCCNYFSCKRSANFSYIFLPLLDDGH